MALMHYGSHRHTEWHRGRHWQDVRSTESTPSESTLALSAACDCASTAQRFGGAEAGGAVLDDARVCVVSEDSLMLELGKEQPYLWRVGDVFTDGVHRWAVDSVQGEKAVLRSCGSSLATTIPLAFSEWREGGRWRLEAQEKHCGRRGGAEETIEIDEDGKVSGHLPIGPIREP